MISPPPIPVETPRQSYSARWIIAALVSLLVLNGLLLPLISLGSYHRTIADSLSRSLGHTVHLRSVNLAVFPLPGLVIHDLTVEDDPSFGAEPLLHAPTVTVFLRVSSLWRQRLEVSRIKLDNASVNLARDPSGRWNFSSLLLQATRTPTAPTAQRRHTAAPRFPYIEFNAARINFKEGVEKKALSFLNADASIWLADPNQWHIRFAAQPARTDLDLELADTGVVRLDGSLTRATSLDQLPLDLHAEWTGAQLGQASRLMLGSDSGWRGDLRAQADVTGNISNLALHTRLSVSGAHRVEFTPLRTLDIDAACDATYRHDQHVLDNLTCLMPTGDGHLLLTGVVRDLSHPQPRLNLEINHTPASLVVTALGLVRSTLPANLSASGTINGSFNWMPETPTAPSSSTPEDSLSGHAVADNVSLQLGDSAPPLTFAALRFATPQDLSINDAIPSKAKRSASSLVQKSKEAPFKPAVGLSGKRRISNEAVQAQPASTATVPNTIQLEPTAFNAGGPSPMQLSGEFSPSGFSLHFTGQSSVARLQPLARNLAQLHALASLQPKGTVESDLTFAGPWLPSANPETGATLPTPLQGWTRLQHAALKPAWLPEPIEITSATAQFANGTITWTNAAISVNGISAKGSATWNAACADPAGCPAEVTLDLPALDTAALQSALLGAGRHGEFLNAILSTVEAPAPPWPPINATIRATALTAGRLKFSNARADIAVRHNRVNIQAFDAATLGGSAHITGTIEPASDGPNYALNIAYSGLKLADAAALFDEKWGTAALNGQLTLNLRGYSDLAATATGDFRFTLNGPWGGDWNQPANSSDPAADLSQWTAAGTVSDRTLTFTKGPAQGTIAFDRTLNLTWTPAPPENQLSTSAKHHHLPPAPPQTPSETLQITGTLSQPAEQTPNLTTARARSPRNN